jgi:hypothetical protein
MSYFLAFNGTNQYATITANPMHQNRTQYAIKARLTLQNAGNPVLYGRTADFNSYVMLRNDGFVRVKYGSTTLSLAWARPAVGVTFDLEIQRNASSHKLYIDGVLQDEVFNATTSTNTVNVLCRYSTAYSQIDLYSLQLYDAPTGGALIYDWNADSASSSGAGSTLYDDTGTNNATLINSPSWVFYSAGGGIVVSESISSLTLASLDPVITLTSTLFIAESINSIELLSFDPSVVLTPENTITVSETSATLTLLSLDSSITLSAGISIAESTKNIAFVGRDPLIGEQTYLNSFFGYVKINSFFGYVKTNSFSGTIKTLLDFSGFNRT